MTRYVILFFVLFLTSCASSSLEDFREEGQGVVRSLVQELQAIQNKQDLVNAAPLIRNHFNRLAAVMVAAQEWTNKQGEACLLNAGDDHSLSDQLRAELQRIYRIPDGRELIEQYQEEALSMLKP